MFERLKTWNFRYTPYNVTIVFWQLYETKNCGHLSVYGTSETVDDTSEQVKVKERVDNIRNIVDFTETAVNPNEKTVDNTGETFIPMGRIADDTGETVIPMEETVFDIRETDGPIARTVDDTGETYIPIEERVDDTREAAVGDAANVVVPARRPSEPANTPRHGIKYEAFNEVIP